MKKILKITSIGLFAYLFICLFVSSARAQQQTSGLDLTISPSLIELSNVPGAKIQSRFRIRNNLDQPIKLQLYVGKLITNGDDLGLVDAKTGDEFISWLTFDQASISARPKEWTDVKYTINIPETAAFGYYYAIRIKQVPSGATAKNTAAKVLGEILIPILLDVQKDGQVAAAKIIEFKPASFMNEYMPVDFITRIQATGNVHIKPRGNIFIHIGGEKDSAVLDVNPSLGNILPGGTRTFHSSWDDGFFVLEPVVQDGSIKLDKKGKPVMHLVINWNKLTYFRIGKYTANALVIYDNGKRDVALEANTSFWIFPYTIIGITVLSIIVLIILIRLMLQWYVKRQVRKYSTRI